MMDKKASGKILEVNLTSGITLPKSLDSDAVKTYIGGLGLCAKFSRLQTTPCQSLLRQSGDVRGRKCRFLCSCQLFGVFGYAPF